MPGPLHGYRIIDLTSMMSGPFATMILADQGADVIKVENPQGGDHTRAAANRRDGFSASFLNNNRNKRSIALDLKTPAGGGGAAAAGRRRRRVRAELPPRRGRADGPRRGRRSARVAPDIVYVSISGFGEQGPYRRQAGL